MESKRQPGDVILDRCMPDARPDVREAARRRLFAYVDVLLRISMRLEREAEAAADSPNSHGRHRLEDDHQNL